MTRKFDEILELLERIEDDLQECIESGNEWFPRGLVEGVLSDVSEIANRLYRERRAQVLADDPSAQLKRKA